MCSRAPPCVSVDIVIFHQLRITLPMRDRQIAKHELSELRDPDQPFILATAIRDFKYMSALSNVTGSQAADRRLDLVQAFPDISDLAGDPFQSRYCTLSAEIPPSDPLRSYLAKSLPRNLTYTQAEMNRRTDEYLARRPPETVSPFVDKLARFVLAMIGGLSLVVPMLIMSLPEQHKTKSLITVSVAVVLFAAGMSLGIRAGNSETLAATATYAAVLVVFVGTSN